MFRNLVRHLGMYLLHISLKHLKILPVLLNINNSSPRVQKILIWERYNYRHSLVNVVKVGSIFPMSPTSLVSWKCLIFKKQQRIDRLNSNSLLTSNKEKYLGWSVRHVVLHEDSIKTTGIQKEGMSMILFILWTSMNRTLAWRKANMIWFRTFLLEALTTLGNGKLLILKDLRKKKGD